MNAKVYDFGRAQFERSVCPNLPLRMRPKYRCKLCKAIGHDARQCNTPAGVERRERRMRELRAELHTLAATAPKHAIIAAIKAIKRCDLLAEARALAAKEGIPYLDALARLSKEADHG